MKKFGLIGEKLGHSLSPEIHSEIFREINVSGKYSLHEIERENIKNKLDQFVKEGYTGINITIPYKQDLIKYLDSISDEAREIGAINTIHFDEGKLHGYNTDYFGFGTTLDYNNINIQDKVCVVLGNGGASKAVAQYLKNNGAIRVYVVSRQIIKLTDINGIKFINYDELSDIKEGFLLVNSTPVGMYPRDGESTIDREIIKRYSVCIDLIYNPKVTRFMEIAKEEGLGAYNGLLMLVSQAIKAEEIWHDKKIDNESIKRIYEEVNKKI